MTRDVSLAIGENLKARKGAGYKTPRFSKLSRTIAARVRVVREARGLKQDELELRAGFARGYVSGIESGARGRSIGVDAVVALAGALRVDLVWLITGHGRSPFGVDEGAIEQQALPFERSPAPAVRAAKKPGRTAPKPPLPKASAHSSQASAQPSSKPRASATKRGTQSGRASKRKTKRAK